LRKKIDILFSQTKVCGYILSVLIIVDRAWQSPSEKTKELSTIPDESGVVDLLKELKDD
jgi:hypothetical protein